MIRIINWSIILRFFFAINLLIVFINLRMYELSCHCIIACHYQRIDAFLIDQVACVITRSRGHFLMGWSTAYLFGPYRSSEDCINRDQVSLCLASARRPNQSTYGRYRKKMLAHYNLYLGEKFFCIDPQCCRCFSLVSACRDYRR